jgi:hypothetical protein
MNVIVTTGLGLASAGAIGLAIDRLRLGMERRIRIKSEDVGVGDKKKLQAALEGIVRSGALFRMGLANDSAVIKRQLEDHIASRLDEYNGFVTPDGKHDVTAWVPKKVGVVDPQTPGMVTFVVTAHGDDPLKQPHYFRISPEKLMKAHANGFRDHDAFEKPTRPKRP